MDIWMVYVYVCWVKSFDLFHTKLSNDMTFTHSCRVILGRKPYCFPHYTEASGPIHPFNPGITQQFLDWEKAYSSRVAAVIKDDRKPQ